MGRVIFLQAYRACYTKNATVHLSNYCLFHWCHRYSNELPSSCQNTQGLYVIPRFHMWVRLRYPVVVDFFLFMVSRTICSIWWEKLRRKLKKTNESLSQIDLWCLAMPILSEVASYKLFENKQNKKTTLGMTQGPGRSGAHWPQDTKWQCNPNCPSWAVLYWPHCVIRSEGPEVTLLRHKLSVIRHK